jgi:hypothetical protein
MFGCGEEAWREARKKKEILTHIPPITTKKEHE